MDGLKNRKFCLNLCRQNRRQQQQQKRPGVRHYQRRFRLSNRSMLQALKVDCFCCLYSCQKECRPRLHAAGLFHNKRTTLFNAYLWKWRVRREFTKREKTHEDEGDKFRNGESPLLKMICCGRTKYARVEVAVKRRSLSHCFFVRKRYRFTGRMTGMKNLKPLLCGPYRGRRSAVTGFRLFQSIYRKRKKKKEMYIYLILILFKNS